MQTARVRQPEGSSDAGGSEELMVSQLEKTQKPFKKIVFANFREPKFGLYPTTIWFIKKSSSV